MPNPSVKHAYFGHFTAVSAFQSAFSSHFRPYSPRLRHTIPLEKVIPLRKLRNFVLLLLALVPLLAAPALKQLPLPKEGVVQEMYARWSGVLRLWVSDPSLASWISGAAARFSRSHNGVYVQVSVVSEPTLLAFSYAAATPPDILVFPAGFLESGDGLLPIECPETVLPSISSCGQGLAVPIAMNGFVCAVHPAKANGTLESADFLLSPDTAGRSFSASLIALLTGNPENRAPEDTPIRYGMDLGLPTPTPSPRKEAAESKEIRLSAASERTGDAISRFARGEAASALIGAQEIAQLRALDDSGRGSDWEILFSGQPFTDQIALFSIADSERADREARREMCIEFLNTLLSDESQRALSGIKRFRATQGDALYAGQRGYGELEAILTDTDLLVPPAFGSEWRGKAANDADVLLRGEGGAQEMWKSLWES